MKDFLITVWKVIVNNKEIMSGILGIQVLLVVVIVIMLTLDEDEPVMRQ